MGFADTHLHAAIYLRSPAIDNVVVEHVHGRSAYSLAEAAELLHVTPQRVSQMLRNGDLTGPDYPGRAPRRAGRVWQDVLAVALSARRADHTGTRDAVALDSPLGAPESEANDLRQIRLWADGQERRLRASAQNLKVAADLLRDQLESERRKAARDRQLLLDLVAQSAAAVLAISTDLGQHQRRDDAVLQQYSDALTQLLGPDGLEV